MSQVANTGVINIFPPMWDEADSYGIVAAQLAGNLEARGIPVNRMHEGDKPTPDAVLGGILMGWPTSFKNYGAEANTGTRIGITMFESTELPDGWVEELNKLDAVIVPSNWCLEVFKAAGVTVPIYKLALGISDTFKFVQRPVYHRPYTFIAPSRGHEHRKGWHHTLTAFCDAFGDSRDVRLIIKSRQGDFLYRLSNPNVEMICRDFSEAEMAELYGLCDCMVFPTAGEGFGFPPREFAATGGKVLTTNWSGTADDIDEWGIPIPYELETAWTGEHELAGVGMWAKPDVEALRRLMANAPILGTNYSESLQVSQNIRKLYSWQAFADGVLDVWTQVKERHHEMLSAA